MGTADARADAALKEGAAALRSGDLDAAAAAFTKTRDSDPGNIGALFGLAEVARRRNDDKEVGRLLRQAVTDAPDLPATQLAWGKFLSAQGDEVGARTALRRAAEMAPDSVAPQLELGKLLARSRDSLQAAIQQLDSAARLEPNNVEVRLALADAYLKSNLVGDAQRELDSAAELAPKSPQVFQWVGTLRAIKGDRQAALNAFDKALEADPRFVAAIVSRADILQLMGHKDKAIDAYNQAIAIDPKLGAPHTGLGIIRQSMGQLPAAREAYLKAVELNPRDVIAHNNLAAMATEQNADLDRALEWATTAVELSRGAPEPLDTLAWVHRARKDLTQAQAALEKAVAANTNSAQIHYHLGVVYFEQGRLQDAKKTLNKALFLDPNFSEASLARQMVKQIAP